MYYLQVFLEKIFLFFYCLTSSYGISILCLSLAVTGVLTPFYYLTGILENREKKMRQRLEPFIEKINLIKDSQVRHKQLQKLYASFKYLPIYSLRSLSSLLIQIPFFIAAYNFLSAFTGFDGVPFLIIPNLGRPDEILFGTNLLPILMTLINLIATIFMTFNYGGTDRKQSFIIALFFLVLLYNSPSALVLYWTCNNFINMLRYFYFWIKENDLSLIKKSFFKSLEIFFNSPSTLAVFFCIGIYYLLNLLSYGKFDSDNLSLLYAS
ncbi:MAG: YidC/Oxa1 family membrane protein insertase, partial [Elusimicrobiota bacterium]|nr:YidC/Oxa1 family membrane protein insertase [Elusimicrobiota bacterium]